MRKLLLLGFVFPLVLALCSMAYAASRFEASAWEEACELSRYTCDGVDAPVIEYDQIALAQGLLGYYVAGTRVVFVAVGLAPDKEYTVLVHEMVHYLQYKDAFLHGTPLPKSCEAEREAFEVSDKVLVRLGMPELARNGDLRDYGCEYGPDKR
jgi:hypothetical protein